jgi:transcriptional regulator with XRE-family HTH domain
MDINTIGKQIATLRKERGYTQEGLAEALAVSPQAVSKWENGRSLPETSLLPGLARILDCSVDSILNPNSLQLLEALYGDGLENENVTRRLNRLVEKDRLNIVVNALSMASGAAKGRHRYLLIKYQNSAGVFYTAVAENQELKLDDKTKHNTLPASKLEILAAGYGNETAANDVLYRIKHHSMFDTKGYLIDHRYFPSPPNANGEEYLTLVYVNQSGIHMSTGAEGEILAKNKNQTAFIREQNTASGTRIIPDVDMLPGFGQGMDCTWAGSLTAALKAMGADTNYEKVMGVSGACWRIAFHKPDPGWDYSAVDALVAYDYVTPGYKAFGYAPVFGARVEKGNRTAERQNIVKSIDDGKPVLGINLRVAFEWGVICGYQDNGNELLCRTYFDIAAGTPEKYLPVDNWPFIIIHFSGKGNVPGDKENLVNSLKTLIASMNMKDAPKHVAGYKAYQSWQKDLRDDTWYKKADDENFGRRLDVNYFCFLALCDARRCSAAYLKSSSGLIKSGLVNRMAGIYENISEGLSGLLPALPCLEEGYGKAPVKANGMRKVWTDELRHRQADLYDEIIALEHQGELIARKITG